jgi:hypothetical protein
VGKKKPCKPKPKEHPLGISDAVMRLHQKAWLAKLEMVRAEWDGIYDPLPDLYPPNPGQVLTSVIIK